MTPFRYVMTRRLARPREQLERKDLRALDLGFKTPSHFTSRFRREFGVTPRTIRSDAVTVTEPLTSERPLDTSRRLLADQRVQT
jgi:AraC-like DNA-binding protein